MRPSCSRPRFFRLFCGLWLALLSLVPPSLAIPPKAAGANQGWVYYGLYVPAATGTPEKWVDLNFSFLGDPPANKQPAADVQLKCEVYMNLRHDSVSVKPNGDLDWPTTIGVLTPGTQVKVTEVKALDSNTAPGAKHFWIRISKL